MVIFITFLERRFRKTGVVFSFIPPFFPKIKKEACYPKKMARLFKPGQIFKSSIPIVLAPIKKQR